jgi:hypothetical protein
MFRKQDYYVQLLKPTFQLHQLYPTSLMLWIPYSDILKCSINQNWFGLWPHMHGHNIKFWSSQMYINHNCRYLTNCMKQSPSSEANSCSVSQEISLILWKLEFPIRCTQGLITTQYTPMFPISLKSSSI